MNELTRVTHDVFGVVESIRLNDEDLFSVPDLSKMLEYSNSHKAMRHLPTKHIRKIPNRALGRSGGGHDVPFTTEAGLYLLIFRSNAPAAEAVTDWVTMDLLPTIRQAHSVGIDVVEDLKLQIEVVKEEAKLAEIEAEGAYDQVADAYKRGYRAGRTSSTMDTTAFNPYKDGEQFPTGPKRRIKAISYNGENKPTFHY